MLHPIVLTVFGLIFIHISVVYGNPCFRIPENHVPIKDNTYIVEISGNPRSYSPHENYTITITSSPGLGDPRFTEFTLVAENVNPRTDPDTAGEFFLVDKLDTIHGSRCPISVTQLSTMAKKKVEVLWRAPPTGSGCVTIRAAVYINNWYTDGDLNKVLCEADEESEDRLPKVLEICTACNEARYEVAFQGLWSRNTHPKGFPVNLHKAKLGDVIGASHKYGRSFWDQSKFASPGLKLLGEEGNTSLLETELKQMTDDIHTIIKAKELVYPKLTATTRTICRVDSENHLVSLVSKITPSPDWIVGVTNLDLCLENGSWASSYTLNLYPWDVGTDDGLTYEAVDEPAQYAQLIRPIKSNSPNNDQSPFYDPKGEPVKPLAKLHLTRKKLFDKECNSVKPEQPTERANCEFSDWGEWSGCSVTCGKGVRTRSRQLINSESCTKVETEHLQETEKCEVEEACEEDPATAQDCTNRVWEEWGPCSVTCDNGTQIRYSINTNEGTEESQNCPEITETEECINPSCSASQTVTEEPIKVVSLGPSGPVINCKVTEWSDWSHCDKSLPCDQRYRFKQRSIKVHAQNGGKSCPEKLQVTKKCKCIEDGTSIEVETTEHPSEAPENDCIMGPWSAWSPCTASCGYALRQRTRNILVHPSKNGKPCRERIDRRRCPLPLACEGIPPSY